MLGAREKGCRGRYPIACEGLVWPAIRNRRHLVSDRPHSLSSPFASACYSGPESWQIQLRGQMHLYLQGKSLFVIRGLRICPKDTTSSCSTIWSWLSSQISVMASLKPH